ncbi:MAG: glycosyltransferase family 87 protein [Anaerolineales bacterium]|jgi:hypothetical protein
MCLLLAVLLVALTLCNYRYSLLEPGGNDFLARWNGARAWVLEGRSPYDPSVTLDAQRLIYGRPADPSRGEDLAQFVYPLHSMLFFAPFGLLNYPAARALWMTVLEAGLVGLGLASIQLVGWRLPRSTLVIVLVFALLWYYGLRGLIDGQFAILDALAMVAALLAIQRHRDFVAGLLLGLSTAKPQMAFLLLPFVLVWAISRKRWNLFGWSLAFCLLLPGAFLMVMPDWPLQMWRQMQIYPSYAVIGSPISILVAQTGTLSQRLDWIITAVFVLYLLVEWGITLRSREDRFVWTSLMTLVITNWVAYRTATTNYVVLLPAVFLVSAYLEARWPNSGRALALAALGFVFLVGWAVFLTTVRGNVEQWPAYLPLPTLGLLGLLVVRNWFPRMGREPVD